VSQKKSIVVRINGLEKEMRNGETILELLAKLEKDPRLVAVERNGEIVSRSSFGAVCLESGDTLEVVQFVQGG
jgi:thiamine biosynthesis protein ThiS